MLRKSKKFYHISIPKNETIALNPQDVERMSAIKCDPECKYIKLPDVCFRVTHAAMKTTSCTNPQASAIQKRLNNYNKIISLSQTTVSNSRKGPPDMIYLSKMPYRQCNKNIMASVNFKTAAVKSCNSLPLRIDDNGYVYDDAKKGQRPSRSSSSPFRLERLHDESMRKQFVLMHRESLLRMRQFIDQEILFKTPVFLHHEPAIELITETPVVMKFGQRVGKRQKQNKKCVCMNSSVWYSVF